MGVRVDSQTLKQIPLFQACDDVPLQILAFAAERQSFASGKDLISKGKKAAAAYLILDGNAKLYDDEQVIGQAQPGALLGELAMIQKGLYSITAVASGTVEVARISHELFIRVITEYPGFGAQVFQNLSDRLGAHMRDLDSVRVILDKSRNFRDLASF